MFRKETILFATCLAFAGCNATGSLTPSDPEPADPTDPADPADPTDPTDPKDPTDPGSTVVASSKARLKFKGGELYAKALAGGLSIPRPELCRELGLYDCVTDVHRIALLDVEPYRTGIIEPLDNTVVTTPIAVERVALSACTLRAQRDFADPANAEIFEGLDPAAIPDLDAQEVDDALTALYRRLLQRNPERQEIADLKDLYREMAEVGDPALAETWAATSCFAVATTMEALFY